MRLITWTGEPELWVLGCGGGCWEAKNGTFSEANFVLAMKTSSGLFCHKILLNEGGTVGLGGYNFLHNGKNNAHNSF